MTNEQIFKILNDCSLEIENYICKTFYNNEHIMKYIIDNAQEYLFYLPLEIIKKNIHEISTNINSENYKNMYEHKNCQLVFKEIIDYHLNILKNDSIFYELDINLLLIAYYIYYNDIYFDLIINSLSNYDIFLTKDNNHTFIDIVDKFLDTRNYNAITTLLSLVDIDDKIKEDFIVNDELYYSIYNNINNSLIMFEYLEMIEYFNFNENNMDIFRDKITLLFDKIKPSRFSFNQAKFIYKIGLQKQFTCFVKAKWNYIKILSLFEAFE